jgi:glycosyltransferase involved in cell wall biosynthesis
MDVVNVFTPGHLDLYDSYGLIACQLTRHLDRLGVYVNALPMGDRLMDNQPADIAAIANKPIIPALGGFLLGYPTGYHSFGPLAAGGPRIAVTMFESTEIPPAWVPTLNDMDAVIVPSHFCKDVFSSCGVTTPIHVIPLGVGDAYRPTKRIRKESDPFTFLAFIDRGTRKGWHHASQAFVGAFGDDERYRLLMKMRGGGRTIGMTNPNIDIIQGDMTEQELYELYLSADCLVNPNLGEGFGLIPREFAATGGLSLATNWGGTADDLEQWGLPIDYSLVPAWPHLEKHRGLGEWAEPDIDELSTLMSVVAESRDKWQPKALARAENVRRMYSWETFASRALEVWKTAAYSPAVPMTMEYA